MTSLEAAVAGTPKVTSLETAAVSKIDAPSFSGDFSSGSVPGLGASHAAHLVALFGLSTRHDGHVQSVVAVAPKLVFRHAVGLLQKLRWHSKDFS